MKHIFLVVLILFSNVFVRAQIQNDSISYNAAYLEDQLYLALTYNALTEKPNDVSQNGFSGGVAVGFIKDIPLNSRRSFGVALGLGYQYNAYIQNLKISKALNNNVFSIAKDYESNWLRLHAIDIPFELRWRTSTATKYKFWRIYTGIKASYIFTSKSKFTDVNETLSVKNIDEINKLQLGVTLSAGFSTWNLYVYYGLNPIFEDAFINDTTSPVNFRDFSVGLKFYIM